MDIQDILAAVDDLSPDDLARLKARIAAREQAAQPCEAAEAWQAVLDEAIDAFWEDSTPGEMQTLTAALSAKLIGVASREVM